jgi:hypothetical protein
MSCPISCNLRCSPPTLCCSPGSTCSTTPSCRFCRQVVSRPQHRSIKRCKTTLSVLSGQQNSWCGKPSPLTSTSHLNTHNTQ